MGVGRTENDGREKKKLLEGGKRREEVFQNCGARGAI